jgi:hypothetical protein
MRVYVIREDGREVDIKHLHDETGPRTVVHVTEPVVIWLGEQLVIEDAADLATGESLRHGAYA